MPEQTPSPATNRPVDSGPRFISQAKSVKRLGSKTLLKRALEAGWIKSADVIGENGQVSRRLISVTALEALVQRIEREGHPPKPVSSQEFQSQ
jgi:hypothetical protein